MNINDISRVISLYDKYKAINKVSELYSLDDDIVKRILIDNNIVINSQHQHILDLQTQGYSALEISELLKISIEKVYYYYPQKKYNLQIKSGESI